MGPPVHEGFPVVNCHYAGDTIFFLKPDSENVENVYWTMITFDALSWIKINFQKTELVPLNLSINEGSTLAFVFGCKLSPLLLTYFGIPLTDKNYVRMGWCDW